MSIAKTNNEPLFRAWNRCEEDQMGEGGGKMISEELLEKASRLLDKRKLQQTVDKLWAEHDDLGGYIDLNYKMQTVAGLLFEESNRRGDNEYHLLGIPWLGTKADLERYQEPEFHAKLQDRVTQHLAQLLKKQGKRQGKAPKFNCQISQNLVDANLFGSTSCDLRRAMLEDFATNGAVSYSDGPEVGRGYGRGGQGAGEGRATAEPLLTRMSIVGFRCNEADFPEDFDINGLLLNYVDQAEVWKGTTLSGGARSVILPPMPINTASLFALSLYIKGYLLNTVETGPEEGQKEFAMAYDLNTESFTLTDKVTNNQHQLNIARKWAFACGLSSMGILEEILGGETWAERKDEGEGWAGEEKGEGMEMDEVELQMEGTEGSTVEVQLEGEQSPVGPARVESREEQKAWDEELDRMLPSFWKPGKRTVN